MISNSISLGHLVMTTWQIQSVVLKNWFINLYPFTKKKKPSGDHSRSGRRKHKEDVKDSFILPSPAAETLTHYHEQFLLRSKFLSTPIDAITISKASSFKSRLLLLHFSHCSPLFITTIKGSLISDNDKWWQKKESSKIFLWLHFIVSGEARFSFLGSTNDIGRVYRYRRRSRKNLTYPTKKRFYWENWFRAK